MNMIYAGLLPNLFVPLNILIVSSRFRIMSPDLNSLIWSLFNLVIPTPNDNLVFGN